MSGPAPRKPPVDAYPLLKPDKQRKVDSAPRAERAVFAWLLLIVGQDGWRERKTSCLICSKSGWPCIDPERRGTRKRCEGCWIAGYHCHTPTETPAPERATPPSKRRRRHRRKRKTRSKNHNQQYSESSDEHMDVDDNPKGKQDKRKKKKAKRRVESSDSEAESDGPGVGTGNTRHKAQDIKEPSKRRRIESSPVTGQGASSDIEFISAHEPEQAPMTPIPPRKPGDRHQASHASPGPAPPVKTAAERLQELLGDDSSSDSDNSSDSSYSAPLPPRPLPVRPVPALAATRTPIERPASPISQESSDRHDTPLDAGTRLRPNVPPSQEGKVADIAPKWTYSGDDRLPDIDQSKHCNRPGEQDEGEEDELLDIKKEDIEQEVIEHDPPGRLRSPQPQATPPPLHVDDNTQFTPDVVRRVLAAIQGVGEPNYGISFDGEPTRTATDILLVLPEIVLPKGKGVLPWRIGTYNPVSKAAYIICKPTGSKPADESALWRKMRKNMSEMFSARGLTEGRISSSQWESRECAPELVSADGGLWACVLCLWLTSWSTLTVSLGRDIGKLLIRYEFVAGDLNRVMTKRCRPRMCYVLFSSEDQREKINEEGRRVSTLTPEERTAYVLGMRSKAKLRAEQKRRNRAKAHHTTQL